MPNNVTLRSAVAWLVMAFCVGVGWSVGVRLVGFYLGRVL